MVNFKKKTFRKNTSDGSKALKMVKQMKKSIERKHKDYAITDATVAAAGATFDLVNLTQGVGDDQIIGDQCTLQSLQLRATLTAATTEGWVRYLVVQFLDKRSGTPTISNVLTSAEVNGLYVRNTNSRYKVLVDKQVYILPQNGKRGDGKSKLLFTIKPNVKGVIYDDDGTNFRNQIAFMILHNCTDENVALDINARLTWTDE